MAVRSAVTGEDAGPNPAPGADFVPEAQKVERPPVKWREAGSIPAGYAGACAAYKTRPYPATDTSLVMLVWTSACFVLRTKGVRLSPSALRASSAVLYQAHTLATPRFDSTGPQPLE